MKYLEFKILVKDLPVFATPQVSRLAKDKQVFKNQISIWKKQGLIIPLKKGLYILNQHDRKINPSREFIANQLVFPSYISLESALSFYGLIPEKVFQVTSITSKKTIVFENPFGRFMYRNLNERLFFGFTSLRDENYLQILVAEREKALLDFLYLNLSKINSGDPSFLEESYRFENLNELDSSLLLNYSKQFHSKKLTTVVELLIKNRKN